MGKLPIPILGVPPLLMNDEGITYLVRDATQFAEGCADVIAGVAGAVDDPVAETKPVGVAWFTPA